MSKIGRWLATTVFSLAAVVYLSANPTWARSHSPALGLCIATGGTKDISTATPTSSSGPTSYGGILGIPRPIEAPSSVENSAPSTSHIVTQPSASPSTTVANNTLYASDFPGADIGAKVNAAVAYCSTHLSASCTVIVPPGSYKQTTQITLAGAFISLLGRGATLIGNSRLAAMVSVLGSNESVSGLTFNTSGSTYGVVVGGIDANVNSNHFGGASGEYIAVSGASGRTEISDNWFNGDAGCGSHGNISISGTAHFIVARNHALNTCGFGIETLASSHGSIIQNDLNQTLQTKSITSNVGQTSYTFTWPRTGPTVQRVWIQVNGVPTSTGVTIVYTNASTTTVTLPSAPSTGSTVTALGWTALENIQVNSQSFDITVENNTMRGTGDSGIDVVSDFHFVPNGTATASQNQRVFTITASPGISTQAFGWINGRAQTADQASIANVGSVYTITLSSPPPAGTVVTLMDMTNNQSGSVQRDYPGSAVITGNTVKSSAATCIAAEVAATNIMIANNVLEDCGMGSDTASYSTGIFTGGAMPLVIRNNTISITRVVPTMKSAISVQQVVPDTGSVEKPIKISGNSYHGTFFSGDLYIPAITGYRQSGIDVAEGSTVPYPEQPNLDGSWSGTPTNTRYLSYTATGPGFTRDTTNVTGGVASARITSGNYVNIRPTNQIFFANSIMRISFWAKRVSGTPAVEFQSSLGSNYIPVTVYINDPNWRQYSIYASTVGLDSGSLFLRVDGTTGVLNIQNIAFSATPIMTTAKGTNGTAGNNR